jgi:ABC-type branched-subunit amino acid transport system substrate-binding protein
VIATEFFRPRETDFGPLIMDVKSILMGKISDSTVFLSDVGDTVEPREVPVALECLFIPADPAQLQQLLPQISFYNLKTTYLGGEGWGDKSIQSLGKEVTKTCYFASSRMTAEIGTSYRKFVSEFNKKFKRDPAYLEALGYDAVSLICQALKADHYSRQDIATYLSNISNFNGMAGPILFDQNRENSVMPIFTIEDSDIRQVIK